MSRRQEIIARVLANTLIEHRGHEIGGVASPCFIWQGPTSGNGRGGGYGRMSLGGQTVATHLVVFTHYHGYIPGKKQVDHLCNNRLCCNELHLELVSHIMNQKRRAERQKLNKE